MSKFIKQLTHMQLGIAIISLIAVIVLNLFEITMRYLFNSSMVWIQDVSLLLTVWMVFCGSTVIVYEKKNITITLLTDHLPEKISKPLEIIKNIIILIFFIALGYYSLNLFISQKGQTTVTASIPLQLYTLAVVLNSFSISILYLNDIIREQVNKRWS